jgi:hypothetical protein
LLVRHVPSSVQYQPKPAPPPPRPAPPHKFYIIFFVGDELHFHVSVITSRSFVSVHLCGRILFRSYSLSRRTFALRWVIQT